MKFWGILIGGLILGFIGTGFAQTDMSSTFSSENKNILYSGEAKDYTGSPLVFIEGISDQPRPKNWKDELKIKLFGSMELPKAEVQHPLPPLEQNNVQNSVKVKPLFGDEKEVAFVPHTSDWNFIIQVMDDESILVQENIQLIKTANVTTPIRDWTKQDLELLEVKINGQEIPLKLTEEANTLRLKFPDLETGVHRIHLTYLIKKAGVFSKKTANLSVPLIDMGWNLNTDSLNGIILFPVKIKEAKMTFLLGKNKQEIKGAFDVASDASGAVFFKATHLMPAHSALLLNIDLQYDSFLKKGLWNKLTESTSFMIFIISLMVCFLYLILNIIEIKITPIEEVLLRKKYCYSDNAFKNFLKRTGEMWIGLCLIWALTAGILFFTETSFSIFETQILLLSPVAFVLILDYLLLYPRQRNIQKLRGGK